jgi:predicted dienelactone hydrolase
MRKILLLVLLAALVITPMLAQDDEGPVRTGLRPDAPAYGVRGPHPVGTMELVIDDAERPIPVTVWYPALNAEGSPQQITYSIDYPPFFGGLISEGHALADAAPDDTQGPYPLVIFSHGLWMYRLQSTFFTEHLASHGFVVMAMDHVGETTSNVGEDFWWSYVQRPLDVQIVIDYAEELAASDHTLSSLIDTDQVAVTGYSSGGFTALLAAGIQMNFDSFADWCEQYAHTNELSGCDTLPFVQAEMAEIAGLDTVPDGLWPSLGDARVDAIVALSPDTNIFCHDSLAAASIPSLFLVGGSETVLPTDFNLYPLYASLGSPQKAMVTLEGGDHHLFVDACARTPWMIDYDLFWLCSDAVWDMDRAHDLTNHFATVFLLATLKGDAEAAAVLAPDAVSIPSVTYTAAGF